MIMSAGRVEADRARAATKARILREFKEELSFAYLDVISVKSNRPLKYGCETGFFRKKELRRQPSCSIWRALYAQSYPPVPNHCLFRRIRDERVCRPRLTLKVPLQ